MVVGLFQMGFTRGVIGIVFVRWIAGPVAVGGDDFDHQQTLRIEITKQDVADQTAVTAAASLTALTILRADQSRGEAPAGGRGTHGQL